MAVLHIDTRTNEEIVVSAQVVTPGLVRFRAGIDGNTLAEIDMTPETAWKIARSLLDALGTCAADARNKTAASVAPETAWR